MKKIGIILFVFVSLVLFVLVIPASLMGTLLEKATDQKISLSDAEGTIWSGSGFISVAADDGQYYTLFDTPLVWTIKKLPLLWGELSGAFIFSRDRELNEPSVARFRVSRSEGQIDRISAPINIRSLSKLHRNIELMRLSGSLTLDIQQFYWQHGMITMEAVMLWRHMRSGLARLNTVGSYQALFDAKQSETVGIRLTTLEGPLLLSAEGQISGQGFWLRGTADAEEHYRSDIQNLLMVIGTERQGIRHFLFSAGNI